MRSRNATQVFFYFLWFIKESAWCLKRTTRKTMQSNFTLLLWFWKIQHFDIMTHWRLTFVIGECAARRLTAHRWSPISFCYALLLNVDWAGPTGKRTIWKLERLPQTCLGPQAVCMLCMLNQLYLHSARRRMERNWGSHHRNASFRAALANDDCKFMMLQWPSSSIFFFFLRPPLCKFLRWSRDPRPRSQGGAYKSFQPPK